MLIFNGSKSVFRTAFARWIAAVRAGVLDDDDQWPLRKPLVCHISLGLSRACLPLTAVAQRSAKFPSTCYDTLSILVAKGRARVSVAASEADWSKRIREMQYADYEDHTVGS